MKKILMMVLPLLAFVGGAVGGDLLHGGDAAKHEGPEAETAAAQPDEAAQATAGHGAEAAAGHGDKSAAATDGDKSAAAEDATVEWFRFPSQFFVPIMRNGATEAVMILALTLEMPAEAKPAVEAQEHRLRDALLNALMIQANTGGFDGNFTSAASLDRLRHALLEAAHKAAGPQIAQVLIEDIARQDQ